MLNHAALDKLFREKHSQNLVTGLPARMEAGMVGTKFHSGMLVFALNKK